MERLFFILLTAIVLSSCSDDDDNLVYINESIIGTWVLVEMSGNTPNSTTTKDNMEWQESYQFSSNGSFIKKRIRDNKTIEATGTFKIVYNENDRKSYLLTFSSKSEIIGSCTSDDNSEYLYFVNTSQLRSNWFACDGPGLLYSKK